MEDQLSALTSSSGRHANTGLLLLRIAVGAVMLAHGWQKLFDIGPANFGSTFLFDLGVPLPVFFGYVVTFVELVGGAFLILGVLSRLAALLLTIDLLVAIVLVKLGIGFISPAGQVGAELEVALIGGFLAILFAGPGAISLDARFGGER
jgi:putative oxidoreductase